MKNYHQTNSNNYHQTTNIRVCNFYNLRPIVKLFFFTMYPKYYLSIRYPINHLNGYSKNYTNNMYKYPKYPTLTHYNYKNLKN
jgi:hypothetical protein